VPHALSTEGVGTCHFIPRAAVYKEFIPGIHCPLLVSLFHSYVA